MCEFCSVIFNWCEDFFFIILIGPLLVVKISHVHCVEFVEEIGLTGARKHWVDNPKQRDDQNVNVKASTFQHRDLESFSLFTKIGFGTTRYLYRAKRINDKVKYVVKNYRIKN